MESKQTPEQRQELTKAELEIMQILWDKGEAFVSDILEEMPDPKPAYNTVSTFVRILEKKGVVGYKAFGRSHRYHPLISKEEYTHGFMRNVMNNFFNNSFTSMFSFFSEKENLSAKEIEEVMELAKKIIAEKKEKA